jgi:methyl-accepting chemotaxis protein
MEKTFNKRRKIYYIKKEFQMVFIIKFCLLVILGGIVSGAVIYLVSQGSATTVFENSRIRIKSTADFILPAVLLSTAVVTVLVGLASVIVTLYASHKIAGPIYRIEKDLEKVMLGDLRVKFNLRKNDQLQALAIMIEALVANLGDNIKELRQARSELAKIAEGMRHNGGDARLLEVEKKLQEIDKRLAKFNV